MIRAVWAEDDPDVRLLRISADDLRAMGGVRMETRFEAVPAMLASALATIILDSQPETMRLA
jgi:hypothetical protein